jgi:hypothetical protein
LLGRSSVRVGCGLKCRRWCKVVRCSSCCSDSVQRCGRAVFGQRLDDRGRLDHDGDHNVWFGDSLGIRSHCLGFGGHRFGLSSLRESCLAGHGLAGGMIVLISVAHFVRCAAYLVVVATLNLVSTYQ